MNHGHISKAWALSDIAWSLARACGGIPRLLAPVKSVKNGPQKTVRRLLQHWLPLFLEAWPQAWLRMDVHGLYVFCAVWDVKHLHCVIHMGHSYKLIEQCQFIPRRELKPTIKKHNTAKQLPNFPGYKRQGLPKKSLPCRSKALSVGEAMGDRCL